MVQKVCVKRDANDLRLVRLMPLPSRRLLLPFVSLKSILV